MSNQKKVVSIEPAVVTAKAVVPPLYKDFNKASKDLLTKQFAKTPGDWTYESKLKGPVGALYINPQYNKVFSVDVQYDSAAKSNALGTAFKLNLASNAQWKLTTTNKVLLPKTKIELNYDSKGVVDDSIEGSYAPLAYYIRGTSTQGEAQLSWAAATGVSVGAGVAVKWDAIRQPLVSLAAQWVGSAAQLVSVLVTPQQQTVTTNIVWPFTVGRWNNTFFGQVSKDKGVEKPAVEVGIETAVCSQGAIRTKVNGAGQLAVCAIGYLPNNLTAAVTAAFANGQSKPTIGLSLTQN